MIKISGYVRNGKRQKWLDFGSDSDHCLDLLDPWNVIFKERKLKNLWRDFDEIFRICPKWDKELVMRFWEWSGSLFWSMKNKLWVIRITMAKMWNRGGNISANYWFWKSRNWAPVVEVCALRELLFKFVMSINTFILLKFVISLEHFLFFIYFIYFLFVCLFKLIMSINTFIYLEICHHIGTVSCFSQSLTSIVLI